MMLVQVVALLSLGVLCSSAPLQTTGPANTGAQSPQKKHSRPSVEVLIQEVLHDMAKLNLRSVASLATVNATMERCMQSCLKTFAANLKNLDNPSKYVGGKLSTLNTYENIPKDLDKECKTVHVTSDVFLKSLDRFLRLLFQKIKNA